MGFTLSRPKAFTLIELIIVILLVTILSVAGVFILLRSNKLIAAANKLAFDLRYAQQLAISRQVPCGISFNPSANSYFVFVNNTSAKAKDPYTAEDFIIDYNAVGQLKGIDLASTNFGDLISFNYLGVPRDSGNATLSSQGVVILQYGGQARNVTIEPDTGRVKIQ
ncbi:MAG: GspH/FimT family protein [Candidatus Omnitrophica bacterium]|nr:GspH/FimT family protein [Candidatus Omnitrophota bacterium]